MYDHNNWEIVGSISDPTNLEGPPDDGYAYFMTCGWDQVDPETGGGEACANGPLDRTVQSGQVYIQAATGPFGIGYGVDGYGLYGWCNYVIVWVSDGYSGTQNFVGWVMVDQFSKTQYYVGPAGAYGYFNYISISCWTPPWEPVDYYPHIYNNVLIDTAFVWGSNP
jgi:hypothetical protein